VKIVIEHDGTLEIRPESPFENYALRKWYEDWIHNKVTLRVSWKEDDTFVKAKISPDV
jgi:hypothetical protein